MSGATELAPAEAGGAPGIDDMSVEDLALHLEDHWLEIKAQLLAGTYRPQPVRRVEIPKPAGGVRALGIPSLPRRRPGVLDRLIQQAVLQALQADWDPTFSEASFGFRPGRCAHDYPWWAKLDAAGCRIVTRFKSNTPLRGARDCAVAAGSSVLSDRVGHLPARQVNPKARRNPFSKPVR
jgi:hypothetical protein